MPGGAPAWAKLTGELGLGRSSKSERLQKSQFGYPMGQQLDWARLGHTSSAGYLAGETHIEKDITWPLLAIWSVSTTEQVLLHGNTIS